VLTTSVLSSPPSSIKREDTAPRPRGSFVTDGV
jgi:hypothetical protein